MEQHTLRLGALGLIFGVMIAVGCQGERQAPLSSATSGSQDGSPRTLRVAAAADLRFALPEVVAAFQKAQPFVHVQVTFGASGQLVAQIENGAPLDVFLSADESYARRLVETGLAQESDYFRYAQGHLVLWVPADSPIHVDEEPTTLLQSPALRRIAIANPRNAPYGRAAQAVLEKVKPLEAWKERLVLGDNVAQAFQFAAEGHANAAIVGKALVLGSSAGNAGRWKEIPRDYYPALIQAGVILRRCADRDAALAWRDFLLGEQGQTILQRYGFTSPPPATSAKP